jgi:hypothetical protein
MNWTKTVVTHDRSVYSSERKPNADSLLQTDFRLRIWSWVPEGARHWQWVRLALWLSFAKWLGFACLFFPEDEVGLVPKCGCLLTLAYCAYPRWYEFGERWWNDILTGENRRTRRKTCPSATLPTTNPTRAQNRASAVRGRRLTTWAMARPACRLLRLTPPETHHTLKWQNIPIVNRIRYLGVILMRRLHGECT